MDEFSENEFWYVVVLSFSRGSLNSHKLEDFTNIWLSFTCLWARLLKRLQACFWHAYMTNVYVKAILAFASLDLFVYFIISFTLYPAYNRVGRGNLVVRHSVSHYPLIFWRYSVLRCGTQRLLPCARVKTLKY